MKAILVLLLLAVAGFGLAACGSGAKVAPGAAAFTGPVTTTIAEVQTGETMRCDGMAGAQVPRPGRGVTANADGTSRSATLQLTRRSDGSLVVICTP